VHIDADALSARDLPRKALLPPSSRLPDFRPVARAVAWEVSPGGGAPRKGGSPGGDASKGLAPVSPTGTTRGPELNG
jgi:hypothetical protein